MCGIVAYLGPKNAYEIVIKGLQRLEYRGYDSSGVAIHNTKSVNVYKQKGKVQDLIDYADEKDTEGNLAIGHTRWATHGLPNNINAHPHQSGDHKISLVHNGIIENYSILKKELEQRGHEFKSETDTEVLVHLIEEIHKNSKYDLFDAVRLALNEVIGAYAIVIINNENPHELIAARKSSPLVVGIGDGEYFCASDATPIVEYTKNVVYLEDGEIAQISLKNGLKLKTIANQEITPYIQELELHLEALEKGGYEHFMLKEIYEQPRSILDSMRGRISVSKSKVALGGILDYEEKLISAKRLIFVACGTSWHAGLVGEYLIEEIARIPVEVEYASEFRYRNPIINNDDFVIAISQSGETADTLAALKLAKERGATLMGICNVVGSSISRETDCGSYTHAGPEIGVASTKAFTAQVTILTLMALMMGKRKKTITNERFNRLLIELKAIPDKLKTVLKENDLIEKIAKIYYQSTNALYLGRGINFPLALEGALKLKEISYIHAEGYPAAEMKHGPIALIDEEMPVFVIATQDSSYEKIVSNIQEVKARKGKIIAIVTQGDKEVKKIADHYIEIPKCDELLVPLLATVPLQLLSYHIALLRECNVDQPRNLAKSVTV
ncbi:MAG: glutamine--fructose-6-phosphate transaminase (isomerizing), partial [Crocinitomicaceae bacterium]|nr:glutamine--fructose-6-phosphate transaminase (isomerizing) [Crocinitomicaceae bacterium]